MEPNTKTSTDPGIKALADKILTLADKKTTSSTLTTEQQDFYSIMRKSASFYISESEGQVQELQISAGEIAAMAALTKQVCDMTRAMVQGMREEGDDAESIRQAEEQLAVSDWNCSLMEASMRGMKDERSE